MDSVNMDSVNLDSQYRFFITFKLPKAYIFYYFEKLKLVPASAGTLIYF